MAKIREIQAAAAAKKETEAKAAAEAAEKATQEKAAALESKEGERTQVEAEIGNTTEELAKTESALSEVGAIDLNELDADSQAAIKAEIEGIQAEAEALKAKMAELNNKKTNLDTEIAGLGGGETAVAEAPTEATVEAGVAEAPAVEAAVEVPAETTAEVPKEIFSGAEEIKTLIDSSKNVPRLVQQLENFHYRGANGNPSKNDLARITDDGLEELRKVYEKFGEDPALETDKSGILKDTHWRFGNRINEIKTFLDIRNNPDYVRQKTDEALNVMLSDRPDKGRQDLMMLIENSEAIPGATERLVKELGTDPLDIIQGRKDLINADRAERGLEKITAFEMGGFRNLPYIAAAIENVDPAKADAYHEFILKGVVELCKGNKPEEVRKLITPGYNSGSIHEELVLVFGRMLNGDNIPEGVKKAIAELVPILEGSDSVKHEEGDGEFLTDGVIKQISPRVKSRAKEMDADEKLSTIRNSINALKGKYNK